VVQTKGLKAVETRQDSGLRQNGGNLEKDCHDELGGIWILAEQQTLLRADQQQGPSEVASDPDTDAKVEVQG